jgi:hypothetical protein
MKQNKDDEFDINKIIKKYPELKIELINIKLDVINRIVNMYPELKKEKQIIVSSILDNIIKVEQTNLLTKIIINDKAYYYDDDELIFDGKGKIVGLYFKNDTEIYYSIPTLHSNNYQENIKKLSTYFCKS